MERDEDGGEEKFLKEQRNRKRRELGERRNSWRNRKDVMIKKSGEHKDE